MCKETDGLALFIPILPLLAIVNTSCDELFEATNILFVTPDCVTDNAVAVPLLIISKFSVVYVHQYL